MTTKTKGYLYIGIAFLLALGLLGQIKAIFTNMKSMANMDSMSAESAGESFGKLLAVIIFAIGVIYFSRKGNRQLLCS